MWTEIKKGDLKGYKKVDDIENICNEWLKAWVNIERFPSNIERFFRKKGARVWLYEDDEIYIIMKGREYPLDSTIFQIFRIAFSQVANNIIVPCVDTTPNPLDLDFPNFMKNIIY